MDDISSKKRQRLEDILLDDDELNDDELNAVVDAAVAAKKANICGSEQNGKAHLPKKQVDSSLGESSNTSNYEIISNNLAETSSTPEPVKNAEAFSLSRDNIAKLNSFGEWISVDLESEQNMSSANIVSNVGEDIEFYWYDAVVDPNEETNSVYLFGKIFNSQTQRFDSASLKGNLSFHII